MAVPANAARETATNVEGVLAVAEVQQAVLYLLELGGSDGMRAQGQPA